MRSAALYRLRGVLLFVSLLLFTVSIPIFSVVYFPEWYEANCYWHSRCERLGMETSAARIGELVSFFRHAGDLSAPDWTAKETLHLTEVRRIFDGLVICVAVSIVLLAVFWDRRRARRFAVANALLMVSAAAILPFFGYFWRTIFHGLMFNNRYWLNTPRDISYYITPRVFFFYTVIFIIVMAVLFNVGLYLLLRFQKERK